MNLQIFGGGQSESKAEIWNFPLDWFEIALGIKKPRDATENPVLSTNAMVGVRCLCRSIWFEVDESAIIDVVCDCQACKVVLPTHAES